MGSEANERLVLLGNIELDQTGPSLFVLPYKKNINSRLTLLHSVANGSAQS